MFKDAIQIGDYVLPYWLITAGAVAAIVGAALFA